MVRSKRLPDVPTYYERGLTEQAFQVRGFICLVGSIGMPDDMVQKLSDLMVEGGRSERIQKVLDTFGVDEGARPQLFHGSPGQGRPRVDRPDQVPEHRAVVSRLVRGRGSPVVLRERAASGCSGGSWMAALWEAAWACGAPFGAITHGARKGCPASKKRRRRRPAAGLSAGLPFEARMLAAMSM